VNEFSPHVFCLASPPLIPIPPAWPGEPERTRLQTGKGAGFGSPVGNARDHAARIELPADFGLFDRIAHARMIENEGSSGYLDENKEEQVSGARCQGGERG